jgi:hypothetical protein
MRRLIHTHTHTHLQDAGLDIDEAFDDMFNEKWGSSGE